MAVKLITAVLFFVMLVLDLRTNSEGTPNELEELKKMFLANVTAAQNYRLPVDNAALYGEPNSKVNEIVFGSFDFIVVGAGAAGALLANRLSEIENWNVLLLEAGGHENDFSDIIGVSLLTQFSDMNWGYNTTKQNHAGFGMKDQTMLYPRGKVLGGSSTIGEAMFTRGNPADYDHWKKLGNDGWGYDDVLKYFIRNENVNFSVDGTLRGQNGLMNVGYATDTDMLQVALKGSEEAGLKIVDTNNGVDQTFGVSKVQSNTNYNKRASAGRAFLDKFNNRPNLNITHNAFVTKIMIDTMSKTAQGVKFIKDKISYVARANIEVVVSGGAVNTPQLLMLSGIGPQKHLEELDIDVILDLPVGQNLQDHMYYYALNFRTNHTFYENSTITDFLELYLNNARPLTAGLNTEVIGFIKTDENLPWPDIEYVLISPPTTKLVSVNYLNLNDIYQRSFINDPTTDFLICVMLLHPKSIGNITLKSNNPIDFPLIDPNYLSDEHDEDIEAIYKGIQFVVNNLTTTTSFRAFNTTLKHSSMPTCTNYEELSKDWWYCAIRTLTTSLYHPIGTTSMGTHSDTSVVNPQLMVHGMKNLRVVDAGVMPSHITGHLLAPVYMVAEKAADIIKAHYGLSI